MAGKHITAIIKEYLQSHDITQSQLARKCNTTQSNMSQKLSVNDMELSWVIRISEVLDHNFVYDMAKEIGIKYDTKPTTMSIDELIERKIESILNKKTNAPKNYNPRTIHPSQINEP